MYISAESWDVLLAFTDIHVHTLLKMLNAHSNDQLLGNIT